MAVAFVVLAAVPSVAADGDAESTAKDIYVNAGYTGTDLSNGSKDKPYTTLDEAINAANSGDTIKLIGNFGTAKTLTKITSIQNKAITIDGEQDDKAKAVLTDVFLYGGYNSAGLTLKNIKFVQTDYFGTVAKGQVDRTVNFNSPNAVVDVQNCDFECKYVCKDNEKTHAIGVSQVSKLVFKNNTITGYQRGVQVQSGVGTVESSGNTMSLVSNENTAAKAYNFSGSNNATVEINDTSVTITGKGLQYEISVDSGEAQSFAKLKTNLDIGNQAVSKVNEKGGDVIIKDLEFTDSASFNGKAKVTGTAKVADGKTLTIVDETGELEISKGAVLTVSEGATLTVNGKLTGAVAGTGKLVAGPSSDISGAEIAAGIETEIDPSAMSDMVVGGDSRTGSTTLDINQIVTVSKEMGYWNLVAGANITINGKLIVPEGTTLTVQADATLIFGSQAVVEIDGTIVIEDGVTNADKTTVPAGIVTQKGGKVVVTGTARIAGEYTAEAGEFVAEQGSAVSVEETGKLASSKIVVKDSASFSVEGTITTSSQDSTVYNYGTVVFDSEVAAVADVTVVMMADGATVVVDSYTVASKETTLTVTDEGMVVYEKGSEKYIIGTDTFGKVNKVELGLVTTSEIFKKNVTVSRITIVEKLTSKAKTSTSTYAVVGEKTYDNRMQVSGAVSTATVSTEDSIETVAAEQFGVTLTAGHGITVPAVDSGTALTVGLNVVLTNAANGELTVEGAVDATAKKATSSSDKDASLVNEGIVTVVKDGSVKTVAALAGTVNATHYTTGTEKINNYVEIDAALAMVNASGNTVKALTVLGKQTVDATSAVPADVTFTLKDAQLVIGAKAGADVTLTVSKDGALKGTGTITVNGTLFAENKSKLSVTEIVSDVMSEEIQDGKLIRNGWVKYTNIVAALNGAQAGETITISKANTDGKQYVTIASDIAVKAGVTLVVGDGVAPLLLKNGVTFTVAGTLQTEQAVFAEKQFDLKASGIKGSESSAIVVDGTVRYADGTFVYGYNATPATDSSYVSTAGKAPIAGAYYTDKDYSVISTLAVAIENIEGVTSDIEINGKVSVSDIVFAATDDCSQIVIGNSIKVDDKVKYETLFQASSLTLSDGAQLAVLKAATGSAAGSFTGTVAVGDAAVEIVGATAESSSSSDAAVPAAFDKESEGKLVLLNKIHVCDKGDRLAVSKGTVYMYAGFAVDTIGNDAEISGVFSVESGAVLEPLTDATNVDIETLFVEGTLSVPGKTSVTVGILTVYGNVAVAAATSSATAGTLTVTTMYVGIDASDITKADTGADASVSGAFGFDAVYVADGAVLDADAVAALSADGVKKLAFSVQGKTWFTVYSTNTGDAEEVVADNAPLTDAVLAGWSKTEGGKALKGVDGKALFKFSVNGDYEVLYAVVDTYIYKVTVVAEAGIENIAIDGKLLADGVGSTSVAAGSHTVTYTLRNGYTGTAVMTVNGQKQTGLSFSTSGTSEADRAVSIQLSGITASGYVDPTPVAPEEKDDGMSLTDILLIVLVVLIVIMAAIVALRMMRS